MAYAERLSRQSIPRDYEVIGGCGGTEAGGLQSRAFVPNVRLIDLSGGVASGSLMDHCAAFARGTYLLFVRETADFSLKVVEESIGELEDSGCELSVSQTGTFVLVKQSLYRKVGRLHALLEQPRPIDERPEPTAPAVMCCVRGLDKDGSSIPCGANTFIDPDVVIDSPERVRIGASCVIRKGVVLRAEGGEIVIGDHCVLNHYTVFHGKGGIYIGDWTIIAPHCGLYAQNHTFDSFDVPITKQPNVGRGIYLMGDNWLGAGAVLCDDVTLGKGAVIGANATVTKSVPMGCVAAGSPARVIKKRYNETWDFHQRERATLHGMPAKITEYVSERGRRIASLVDAGDRVLDVGCGEGIITSLLAGRCPNVIGCDYSTEAVELAAKAHPTLQFVCSNSTYLRFEGNPFTKVVLSEVAEHLLPVQLTKTLSEIHRVLKSGGILILSTPLTGKGAQTSTYAHIHEYSEVEIGALMKKVFGAARLMDREFGILVAQKG
jgi:acetyltransferase-like isoleucine patch superfamily enzyme/protein-L-isoaspartate O-methyltransferase